MSGLEELIKELPPELYPEAEDSICVKPLM